MRILFTGASSFTGYWFISALAKAGHDVVATFQGSESSYEGIRETRRQSLLEHCTPIYECAFGSPRFLQLLQSETSWDMLCHHAADVTDYRSDDFDISRALTTNTLNMRTVFDQLAQRGCQRITMTGSVFEGGEGAGSDGLPAFSPYGVSKALTAKVAAYFARVIGLHSGKFVIPNPFGPFEEPRFTAYLVNTWKRGETAGVQTPAYVRDNIHVSLLAAAYAGFVTEMSIAPGKSQLNPSGYIESQGQFAERFADHLRARTDLACELQLGEQTNFDEPMIRVNTDPAAATVSDWSESAAWDELADYYFQPGV